MRKPPAAVRRRLTALGIALVTAASGLLALQSPAQATPPVCDRVRHYEIAPSQDIYAYNYLICENRPTRFSPVAIERYDPATGTWSEVARGSGTAVYSCNGYSPNLYRFMSQVFAHNCA
ncbi:hypothetical protein [Rhizohabitans arisaemae]|uniref:hypothetical protein n=1 Tax=Rhizohabitans arisaemae TaxID=2720610 RepID=UPI0024B19D53|nr:hypothetical protein [Rhizohabitans arisaemae]